MTRKIRTKPRKEAVQERSKATVDAILKATTRILVKDGYDRASTNKIALAAGVSIGSLYQYFPSKEALVAALVERHMSEMNAVIQSELGRLMGAPIAQTVESAVRLMVEAHSVDPKLHKVLVEQVPRVGTLDRVAGFEAEVTALVRHYLESKREELVVSDLDLAAFVVVGIVEALTHAAVLGRPELLGEPFVHEVTSVVVRYLTGGSPSANPRPTRGRKGTPTQ